MTTGKKHRITGALAFLYKKILDMKISLKLTIAYLVGAAICMLILSGFYYVNTKNYVENKTADFMIQTLEQIKGSINSNITLFNTLTDSVYVNPNLQNLLINQYSLPYERYNVQGDIFSYLRPLKTTYKELSRVRLVVVNETIPPYGSEITFESRVNNESWYKRTMLLDSKVLWYTDKDTVKSGRIIVGRKLTHLLYDSFLGVLNFELYSDKFFNSLTEVEKNGQGWFDLLDAQDTVIYSGISEENSGFADVLHDKCKEFRSGEPAKKKIVEINNRQFMMFREDIEYTNWSIYYTVPLTIYADAVKQLQMAALGFLLLGALLFIGISWFLSSNFTRKIRELSNSMEKIQTGQFDIFIAYPGNDEIGHLISGFNKMAKKLKELIEEVYAIKIREKESELQALQAQINPHFLYNTLASISMLGMRTGGEDITRMSNSLARFYKISLSNGNNIIRVWDEIEHVKAYMDIQNIRFKNKINVLYELDESVKESKSLKLMLQPFVENAIGHGIWKDKKTITIRIVVARQGDSVVWEIIDDGVGISRDKLERILNSDENQKQGYGIINVDQRIKIYFGDRYGVNITSCAGMGTVVTINTPLME